MALLRIDHVEAVRTDSVQRTTVDGVDCYAFTVRSGDVQEWDKANIASNNTVANERAEISYETAQSTAKGKSQANVTPASGKQVYRLRYRFKAGFPPARWNVFTQFHPPDDWTGKHGFGGVSGHGTNIDITDPTDDSGSKFIYQAAIKPDVWGYDWDIAVNWASNADGYVVVVDRATGKQLVRWTGVTLPAGMAYKYIKQGYYRNGGTQGEGTVYQTLIDVSAGDLTTTVPEPTPVTTPAPVPTPPDVDFATAHPRAEAGRLQLVNQRAKLDASLLQFDAAITTLQQQRAEIQKIRDATVTVLNAGPWT